MEKHEIMNNNQDCLLYYSSEVLRILQGRWTYSSGHPTQLGLLLCSGYFLKC